MSKREDFFQRGRDIAKKVGNGEPLKGPSKNVWFEDEEDMKVTLKQLLEEVPEGCLHEAEMDFGPDVGEEAAWGDGIEFIELCKTFGGDGLKDDVFDESVIFKGQPPDSNSSS